jgi:hypothetical protein
MFSVWTPVKPISETHERAGEAGVIWKVNKKQYPDHVVVKWDTDGTIEAVEAVELMELS